MLFYRIRATIHTKSTMRRRDSQRIQRLRHLRDLIRALVVRDMKIRYKDSLLGVAWSLVTPVLQLLVYSFVFGSVLRLNIRRYAAFAFIGVLVWNWFQASLVEAAGAITGNRQLIRRPGFPETVLPIIPVLTNLSRFLLAVPVLLLVIGPGGTPVGVTILTLPVLMLLQFVLTLSLAYHVATVNVVFRDTQHLLGVLLQLLFFLTPIFYDVSTIPTPYQGLYHWNPLTHLVNAYRAVLLHGALPEWPALLVVGAVALGLLSLGYWLFLHMTSRFVEEL